MSTVNIIVPTYNRSNLLKECVESLLAQTYPELEIIVVDDGSTDDTQATVADIIRKHSNVKYYSRPHLGAPAARNFGLGKSNGECIAFLDSDDLWPADYVETMIKNLRAKPEFGAAYSKIMVSCGDQTTKQYGPERKNVSGSITAELFSDKVAILPCSVIFRRSAWDGVLWDESLKHGQDFDVFLRLSTRTKFMYVPGIHALRRRNNHGISANAAKNLFMDNLLAMERFYFLLDGKNFMPKGGAFRKMSHRYRKLGLGHYRAGNRSAAITLFKTGLSYYPLDLRLYVNLFKAFLLNPRDDKMPDWRPPPALAAPKHRE